MKHSFNAKIYTDKEPQFDITPRCAICGRYESDHTELAECESCGIIGPCELMNDVLLCPICYDHDVELAKQDSVIANNDVPSRVSQLVNQLGKEMPLDSRAYFVTEVTHIVAIEEKLKEAGSENVKFELARIVEARIATFKQNLFELKKMEVELKTNMVSDQKYLNQIVPQLRAEEREKFKAYDISYQPSVVSKPSAAVSKPRVSASDKAYASMAAMLGITVEQYKLSLSNAMKTVTGVVCTCKETPGICKVHV